MENAKKILLICLGFFLCNSIYAIEPSDVSQAIKNELPGSTQPGVLSNYLSNQGSSQPPAALPAVRPPAQEPSSLGPQATQIKFKLTQVILSGNHIYSERQLSALYKNEMNKEISVAELQNLVQGITNYYRNNGYILSRAILPPQHVQNGIVHIQIIEGYISHVSVIGTPKGARPLVQAYGDKIAESRPLQIKVMEHYLRLANEIPGTQVKAVLEPSKTETGASDLNLAVEQNTFAGSFSYDNYGTRYIGPNQDTLSASLNSIFRPGDMTRGTYATTTRPEQLKFYDVTYQTPFGSNGLTADIGKNHSSTLPGMNLAALDIKGLSNTYYAALQYPLLRTRSKNLTLDGGFDYLDSGVTSFGFRLYNDHIRNIKFGANYDFSDRFNGSNLLGLHLEQGLNLWGASNNQNSTTTSRFGADGIFTKLVGQAARVQPLFGKFSAFVLLTGQYSFNPLLASEQFAFGGSQLGRGYDPAEIIGDKGYGGTVELRMDQAPGWRFLNSFEPYIFYDGGVIYNLKNVTGIKSKQSITSTGFGSRFIFTANFSGNLMIAQPLTKSVSAMELIGRGRNPRGFFSIVASV
ncbi:MAG TPA: ShlB/FhaC/HecB family hemolysin secretion/activation protein [Gammaproteobacteria bacterium]|nr:ShlB/FhaC/HecB family hemolysin secretion/activation protein [Gammaproteobacteria bacterium]